MRLGVEKRMTYSIGICMTEVGFGLGACMPEKGAKNGGSINLRLAEQADQADQAAFAQRTACAKKVSRQLTGTPRVRRASA